LKLLLPSSFIDRRRLIRLSVFAVVVQVLGEPAHLIGDVPVEFGSGVRWILVDVLEELIRESQPLDGQPHVVRHGILGPFLQDSLLCKLIQCARDAILLLIIESKCGFIAGVVGGRILGWFFLHPIKINYKVEMTEFNGSIDIITYSP